jgi:predicted MFS family arabinose efflux permease
MIPKDDWNSSSDEDEKKDDDGQAKATKSTSTDVISLPSSPIFHPTTTLCILVMIDMLSVSLVVPLLHQYYQNSGVHSARQRELLSSLFSSSQIAGGLIIGALSDVGLLSRRNILFLSFLGSAVSYALIVVGGLRSIIFSRVLVGLVKQTMTVSTGLLANYTGDHDRGIFLGRLNASTTISWIVGPSLGALLYKHIGPSAPCIVASGLFLLNSVLAAVLLPRDDPLDKSTKVNKNSSRFGKYTSFFENLRACFASSKLGSVIISVLLFGWVTRTTSYANMASFYEEKYGIEPHFRGYIKSYQQCLSFVIETFFLRYLLSASGGEIRATVIGAVVMALATLCEVYASFNTFAVCVCPLIAASVGMVSVSLRSLTTLEAHKDSLGSVLAALDVLSNAVSVTVPFYRTFLFNAIADNDDDAAMVGDPTPERWLLSSFTHWTVFAIIVTCLLMWPSSSVRKKEVEGAKKKVV